MPMDMPGPPKKSWTDRALLLAWRNGDREAGDILLDRHYETIVRFFQTRVVEPDELIQQTMLGCIESVDRFRIDSNFRSYLLGIAVNKLCNHYRALNSPRNHSPLHVSILNAEGESPSQLIAGREEERLLLEALRRLPVDLQLVLTLFYWERLKTHELAEVLGWRLGTVRDRLRRARHKLEGHIAQLTDSKQKLASTLTRLDEWIEGLRQRAYCEASEGEPGEE